MKSKKTIIGLCIVLLIVVIIVARLVSNKNKRDAEIRAVSEFSVTVPVITDTVKHLDSNNVIVSNGNFEAAREITVASETQGKVTAVKGDAGSKVATGQTLAETDHRIYISQLNSSKFNMAKAEKDMKRYEEMAKGDAATTQQTEQAKQAYVNAESAYTAAKIQYENSIVKSPFNGIITKRYIEIGTYLQPGMPVFDIVDMDHLKLVIHLTGSEVSSVKEGQIAEITVDMYPNTIFEGKVKSIVVKADASKRFEVELEIKNRSDKKIKPGMFGTCTFNRQSNTGNQLIIPRKALNGSIKDPDVFVVTGNAVTSRKIDAVPLDDKNIVVKNGLKEGEIIVVSGQINLVEGTKVKITR